MRNKILTAFLLLLLPFFLTACSLSDIPVIGKIFGGGNKPSNKPVTLNYIYLWESDDVMSSVADKFKEKYPNVTISPDNRSIDNVQNYKDRVFEGLKQKNFADVVLIHNSWVPSLKDYLEPLPTDFSVDSYKNNFYPVAYSSAVLPAKNNEPRVYAVPLYYDGIALVYNKKHFAQINQKNPPTSWEEFRSISTKLQSLVGQKNPNYGAAAIGAASNIDFYPDILGSLFLQINANVPADLEKKPVQDALTFYTNFVTKDKVWSNQMPEASKAFAAEVTSMIFVPSWNLLDILQERPDLDIGVAPIPQAKSAKDTEGATNVREAYAGSFWMLAVPSQSSNKGTALEYVKFFAEESTELSMHSTAIEKSGRKYGTPYALVKLRDQLANDKYLYSYLSSAEQAYPTMFVGRSGNDSENAILKEIVDDVASGDKSMKEAITAALAKQKK
jgi:ABC-type glycerol-3-phosphate transport system substrate-binding protein